MGSTKRILAILLLAAGCGTQIEEFEMTPVTEYSLPASCEKSYPDFCIPSNTTGLTCLNTGEGFAVLDPDPYGFDSDGDGIGCNED